MTENVFIAWGGNAPMALRVGEILKERGYFPEVGGTKKGASPQSFTVNANVIEQMQRSSIAIILVQKIYENGKPTNEFRPNIMFEWGYLARQNRNDCIHVYLIGLDRRELPTDLIGGYTHEVTLQNPSKPSDADIDAAAQAIVNHFVSDVSNMDLDGLEILQRYDHYRAMLDDVSKSKSQFSSQQIGYVILHMIQPAFYKNDLSFIADCLKGLSTRATEEFSNVLILADQILKYYEVTDELTQNHSAVAQPSAIILNCSKRLRDIERALGALSINRNKIYNIFDVLVDNFRGLASLRLFYITNKKADLVAAKKAFESALIECCDFRSIHPSNENFVRSLWQSYIQRNLSRVYHDLGDAKEAQKHGQSAELARIKVQSRLSSAGVAWLAKQFDIEIGLSMFDQAISAGADEAKLTEIVDEYLAPHTPRGVDRVWDRLHAALLKEAAHKGYSPLEARLKDLVPPS